MADNKNLKNANKEKKNEFYTQYEDIQAELNHYEKKFKEKVVFCNCDDPVESQFCFYFLKNFNYLGLKRLICTCYRESPVAFTIFDYLKDDFDENATKHNGYVLDIKSIPMKNGRGVSDDDIKKLLCSKKVKKLNGDGDFRSKEVIEYLEQSDIVVTNPPFSLFREYIAQLVEYKKKFLIIGNQNAISYKDIFKLIKENKLWLGASIHSGDREFRVPDSYPLNASGVRVDDKGNKYIRVKGVRWFTNIDYNERHEDLPLIKKYNKDDYPDFVNYKAINVDKTNDIPRDYKGIIGVPLTFMDKYNPEQFEIVALGIVGSCEFLNEKKMEILDKNGKPTGKFTINAKGTLYRKHLKNDVKPPAFKDCKTGELYQSIYVRILIKNKRI